MTLHQINALKRMKRPELVEVGERFGVVAIEYPTTDALRLAIIDAIVERELEAKAALDEGRLTP